MTAENSRWGNVWASVKTNRSPFGSRGPYIEFYLEVDGYFAHRYYPEWINRRLSDNVYNETFKGMENQFHKDVFQDMIDEIENDLNQDRDRQTYILEGGL